MLRRPATTIKLTPEDILEYDELVAKQQEQPVGQQQILNSELQESDADTSNISFKDSSYLYNQNPPPIQVTRSRDDRIGVNRN